MQLLEKLDPSRGSCQSTSKSPFTVAAWWKMYCGLRRLANSIADTVPQQKMASDTSQLLLPLDSIPRYRPIAAVLKEAWPWYYCEDLWWDHGKIVESLWILRMLYPLSIYRVNTWTEAGYFWQKKLNLVSKGLAVRGLWIAWKVYPHP